MGNGFSQNKINITNKITNDYLTNLNETCSSDCNAKADGNTFILAPGVDLDRLNVKTTCPSSASCSMSNIAENVVQNVLSSISDQSNAAVTDIAGDLAFTESVNSDTIRDIVTNHITQVSAQTCQNVSNVSASNNFVYLGNGSNVGILDFGADGSASSSCSISNMSKIQAYNKFQEDGTQSNKTKGMIAMIAMAIIVVVVGVILIFIFLLAAGVFKGALSNKDKKGADTTSILENIAAVSKLVE